MRRVGQLAVATTVLCGLALGGASQASPRTTGTRLGPLLRVQSVATPTDVCPSESEPEITWTPAGTWVAYNDLAACPHAAGTPARPGIRLTAVQLVPARGKARRQIELPSLPPGESYVGDPDLAPDPDGRGGVLLSTLVAVDQPAAALHVAVVRIPVSGASTLLPSPSLAGNDDKEFLAVDTGGRSRFRGRSYLVWMDFASFRVTLRAYDGRHWLPPVRLGSLPAQPDVAVAPNGDVAVAYSTDQGVSVAVSRDGGITMSRPQGVLRGDLPGRVGTTCDSQSVVGERQRASRSPRVAWDARGGLHVVAALMTTAPDLVASSGLRGGQGRILHATSRDRGRSFAAPAPVTPASGTDVQWAPAIAALPKGGVAISYLQTAPAETYDAFVAVQAADGSAAGPPLRLSEASGPQPELAEAYGSGACYGLGDYVGLAPTPTGAVAAWPTTVGVQRSFLDTDIAVRQVYVPR